MDSDYSCGQGQKLCISNRHPETAAAAAAAADNDDAMELFVQKTHVARGAVNFHSSFCLE